MPQFEYTPFNAAPYAASVAELLAHQHDAAARAAIATGEAQAGARAANGDVWGRTIANVAQIPQQVMQQQRREAEQKQIGQLRQSEIDQNTLHTQQQQRAQAGMKLLGDLHQQFGDDYNTIADKLTDNGYRDEASQYRESGARTAEHKKTIGLAQLGAVAHSFNEAKRPEDVITDLDSYVFSGLISPQQRAMTLKEIQSAGPDGFDALRQKTIAKADQLLPAMVLKEGDTEFGSVSGTPIVTARKRPPTEAELAAIATDPARPQAERDAAKAAMALLKPAPNRTAEQDDAKYRDIIARGTQRQPVTPEDAAWASAYEKQKTLGVDKSAGAASDRQANAIAAQTAQQARAQGFTEAQAGRKELTEKVEAPFRQAQQSAQELRDLVHLAQSGNKEAASLQALQATMSTVRANGLNRLNQAEMRLPAEAGSLWDKVQGRMGKLVSGQPIDGALQKDLLELADFLEKGAYNRYATAHKDVTTRYKLGDEKPAAPPAGYFSIAAPDGKTYTFPSQDAMDAFKKSAGIR